MAAARPPLPRPSGPAGSAVVDAGLALAPRTRLREDPGEGRGRGGGRRARHALPLLLVEGAPVRRGADRVGGDAAARTSRAIRCAARTDVERLTEVFHRSVRAFQRQPQLARLIATLETSSDVRDRDPRPARRSDDRRVRGRDARRRSANRACDRARGRRVLASGLRSWVAGHMTITEANERLAEAVALLLR